MQGAAAGQKRAHYKTKKVFWNYRLSGLISACAYAIIKCTTKGKIMGPCDYSDLVASQPISDVDADKAPGGETVIIGWIMGCVAFPVIIFIGLWVMAHSLEVGVYGFIGLGLWGASRYGTKNSLVARLRYRTFTKRERLIIARRLSE